MKIFDVGNSKRIGMWVIASDANDAEGIAKQLGHIKKKANNIEDVTQAMQGDSAWTSLSSLLSSGKRGQICKQIEALSFMDLLSGKQPSPGVWVFAQEV